MEAELSEQMGTQLSGVVSRATGLNFPHERWAELRRGIVAAAGDLGFANDADRCIRWLATGPLLSKPQIESLASHLTIGETYFFREPRHFDFLAQRILPELVKRENPRQLRIWCAACCTGEEAYSIAIALRRSIPDLERWQVTLLATDINPLFLRKAQAGIFGPWSFRDAPDWLKPQYFRATRDGQFELLPEIRRMVKFAPLNLATDPYPSLLNDAHGMDVVFCRNVLMYFTPTVAAQVVENIHRAQRDEGWLFVASSELLHLSTSPYSTVNVPDVVLFRKIPRTPIHVPPPAIPQLQLPVPTDVFPPMAQIKNKASTETPEEKQDPQAVAAALYAKGSYKEAADILVSLESPEGTDIPALHLLARCLANQGDLAQALNCCEQAIALDKCNAVSQYLRALILQEQGAAEEAILALRRVLYLDPRFVLAHVALGTLSRDRSQTRAAQKHLRLAMEMLHGSAPEATIPESEGITAGQLTHMIRSLMHEEAVP